MYEIDCLVQFLCCTSFQEISFLYLQEISLTNDVCYSFVFSTSFEIQSHVMINFLVKLYSE